MRDAMAQADLGDDVYGEDPTVQRLEERLAKMLGKERAMFFPSGTMANQACLRLLTRAGDLVLGSKDCHIQRFEAGAAAGLSGLHVERLGDEGHFDAAQLRAALPPDDPHFAPASVVAIENTHNAAGGRVFPADHLDAIVSLARKRGLSLHLDGARLFNAAVASGRPAAELAAPFDTVSVCLSKGLGAPVGSVVATNEHRLGALLRIRKMLGGGMRQAGMLAAAGLYALEHHVERLVEDHTNASRLAEGLAELGAEVTAPETNIVMFRVEDLDAFVSAAASCGVKIGRFDATRLRAVTHLDVSAADIGEALTRMKGLFRT
ncbi:MAG: aminotransferase class I/II-fold pyridoxal phosphate-dependent enzyme [bacterium]|nr:aminotransferase class I/II-fold pyridoxal phosphate-dependent enzyme [bacterium]